MIFTKKVNRLEHITRNGFDNTADEKKQLMNYFSQLERNSDAQAARISELEAALERTKASLEFPQHTTVDEIYHAIEQARTALDGNK